MPRSRYLEARSPDRTSGELAREDREHQEDDKGQTSDGDEGEAHGCKGRQAG